jgi:D-aminopeptidase
MVAFTSAHRVPRASAGLLQLASVANDQMCGLFEAAVDATAESVVNSICAAHTTDGRDAQVAHALPLDRLAAAMRKHGREARSPGGA